MAVVTDNQIVSLHTLSGVQLYQFLPGEYSELNWTRNSREVSTCDLTVPPLPGVEDRLGDLAPWLHWLSVWDGDRNVVLWTGPMMKPRANRFGLKINAKDHAAYLVRTRDPMTKRWDAADPAWVAGELWDKMLDQKGIAASAIVRPDPEGERYDFQSIADEQMLDQTINDLVEVGLHWAVTSGVPILGPLGLEPILTLDENDFLGDGVDMVRDGSAIFNDVLVRGSDNYAHAQTAYYGQSLQTIKNLDRMSGVSNVQRAAYAFVGQTGVVRTRLELPADTILRPDAPVTIDELMPSTRFTIQAQGVREMMGLTGVDVTRRAGAAEVKVSMETVLTTQEKLDMELDREVRQPEVTLGGAASR